MAPREGSGAYHFDAFCLDPARGALLGPDGAELRLRPKPFALLQHLLDNPGRLLGRDELMETLWPGVVVTDDSLTQCISDLRRAFGDRAAHVLRTIPKRGYVLTAEVRQDAAPRPDIRRKAVPGAEPEQDIVAQRQALVAVHRFEAPDGNQAAILLADTLVTDMMAFFARLEGLRILPARDGMAAEGYRVRGEVRAAGTDLRVTLRLEDAASEAVLWAERLDRPRDEPRGLPEPALLALAAHLEQQVERHSLSLARRKPVAERSARELCLVGREHHQRGTEADTLVAKEMFALAIAADPDYATAYAWQAYTVHRSITHGWGSPGGQAARDESLRLARKAVQLQPDSPLCLSRLAFSLVLHQQWEGAVDAARAALSSAVPAFASARNTCCEVLAAAGHPEEAVVVAQETISLDPLCPPTTQGILGRALLMSGKVENALSPLRWCASRLPDYAATYDSLLVAAVESGRVAEALAARREFSRIKPGWVPRNHTGYWFFRRDEDVERFVAAYRRASELAGAADKQSMTSSAASPQAEQDQVPTPPKPAAPPPPPEGARSLADLRRDTLVMHPLQAAPDDASAARTASTLTLGLMAELVRYEDLCVVGEAYNRASQDYALRGDAYVSGDRVHAVLRLEEVATGAAFWAQRLDWPLAQPGGLPAESAALLATAVNLQVGRRSLRRARQKPMEQLTARELTLLGREVYNRSTPADTRASRDLFVRAAAVDPGYAPARAWHVFAISRPTVQGWPDGEDGEGLHEAVRLARLAVELEPDSPLGLAALSLCLALREQWGEAVASARLALRTDQVADDAVRMTGGSILAAAGFPEEAEVGLRQMIAWDPHCPPVVHAVLGRALLLRGQPEEALAELRLCAARLPDYELCLRTMVVAAIEAGDIEEARKALREVARLRPGWVNGTDPIFWFMRKLEDRDRHQQAFEMAVRLEATARAGGLLDACTSTS
ncbi:winged helix-turn-helix domain-containing protein [Pararoseomonas indoligenes]|uniref:Winged helix-turn-helix domain-containing protein n=1 Tax=Roseomonas indoligenes TaxID=2820811 RepID=A0A940S6P9_9PROT|nr:winged helix-turn-helix domain-containing protein [Pararoseomonas indoligenes]MBP0495761.1 winged helix-turn-helix domain-containing protein [Pararoseomonas indoligenes]